MNLTLMWATFRKTHWIRFAILSVIFLTGFFSFSEHKSISQAGQGDWFVWILGSGIIGKDVSEGVLHLLFSRPIKRSEYVFSKWFVVGFMATAVTFLFLCMGWVILWNMNAVPLWQDFLTSLLLSVLICFGASAALVFLSSLVPSLGDLALLFLILLTGALLDWLIHDYHWPLVKWFLQNISSFLFPAGKWENSSLSDITLLGWASYLSTVTIWLTLTIYVLNKKEITYANS